MRPGATVADRFEIERLAGAGGMSSVYRARDLVDGSAVALKILNRGSEHYEERFEREARILADLHHAGIVRYVAHGAGGDGLHYLAIEWLEGEDLADHLVRGKLSVNDAVALVRRLAGALGAAHERGIVHRDVKPSNIFLPGGTIESAKLIDFGIARVGFAAMIDDSGEHRDAGRDGTRTGVTLGTPGYMAPEQARGDQNVDARADVFALGCVIFRCLTGRPPFVGDHAMAILAKIVLEGPPRLRELCPGVPPALDDLVAWMLEKDPDARPRDGNEVFTSAVHIQLEGEQPPARSETRAGVQGRWSLPEITAGEQRLLSVVLVSGATQGASGAPDRPPPGAGAASAARFPLASPEAPGNVDAVVRAVMAPYGGRVEALADLSYLVTLDGGPGTDLSRPAHRSAKVQPRTATDQAAHAARCALALRAALPAEISIALATGPGVTSGRWPVGQVIDRAVALLRAEIHDARALRLERSIDGPSAGQGVRIDGVTAGLLDARFEVARAAADSARAGGDRSALLRGERPYAEWVRTLLGKPTRCVGRERQLKVLTSLYAACVTEPKSLAVIVKAPAGIGKSRVLGEFLRLLADGAGARALAGDDHERGALLDGGAAGTSAYGGLPAPEVWIGCGDPMRSGSPFALLGAAIRAAAGIQDGEPLALRQQKLRARVARSVPSAEQPRVTEFLGEMIGAPFSDELSAQAVQLRAARRDAVLMGDQMRRAWEDFVAAECGEHPVIIVLEDLHWGDLPTVKYIDAALRHSQDAPLMVLALARPEVNALFPELWAGRNVMELRLGELSRKASEELVRDVLGDRLSSPMVERIVERAAGNAFYLEELIRAAADGNYSGLSETMLAMAHARIDTLDPAARRVLRAASVFGEVAWRGGIAALLGGVARAVDLDGWLADLVAREFMEQRPSSRFPAEDEYAFRHGLIREAAYAAFTGSDRVLGHRLAGAWLEQIGELDAMTLAEHFDRGGEPGRAAQWFLRGAEQALEGGDLAAALACAERGARNRDRGLRLAEGAADADSGSSAKTRNDELLGALRLIQAEAHRWRGEFEEAQRCAVQAARRLPRGSLLWLRAADELISASGRRGDYVLTTAWAKEVSTHGPEMPDGTPSAVAFAPRPEDGGVHGVRPDGADTQGAGAQQSEGASVEELDGAPSGGSPAGRAHAASDIRAMQVIALCSAARQLFHAGQYSAADTLIASVGVLAGDLTMLAPRAAAEVHRLHGSRARHIGDLGDDLAGYTAALDAFERAGDVRNACNARVSLGFAYIEAGDFEHAGELLDAALGAANRMGLHTVSTRARQNLGLVLAARGQLDEALALERQVIVECRAQGNLRFEGCTRIYAALIAHRAGDFETAEIEAKSAVDILDVTPPARAGALAALARTLTSQGRIEDGLAASREAVDILMRYRGIEEFESLVLVAYIEVLRASGDLESASAAVAAARDRLLARAEAIGQPALRESFLHRVRENAMLLSLARMCLGESSSSSGRRGVRP